MIKSNLKILPTLMFLLFAVNVFSQSSWLRSSMYSIPVDADTQLGEVSISWSVYRSDENIVTVNSGDGEKDFAGGVSIGSAVAPWIQKGVSSVFKLYRVVDGNRQFVDEVKVTGIDPLPNSSIGMNGFGLFINYLGIRDENKSLKNINYINVTKAMSKKSIKDAENIGVMYFRIPVSGFYAQELEIWEEKPDVFWGAMDELVQDLKASGIKMVPSLAFNTYQFPDYCNETTREFIQDPESASFEKYKAFVADFIGRYKDSGAILFYEVGNEYNLHADLDISTHPYFQYPYDGNYSSIKLGDFLNRTGDYIRTLDPGKMVTSGNSIQRENALHLQKSPEWSVYGADWTLDSFDEFKTYMRELEAGMDIVSVHLYNTSTTVGSGMLRFGITNINSAALVDNIVVSTDELGKLLFIGEFGDYQENIIENENAYFSTNVLNKIVAYDIPFSAPWTWQEYLHATYQIYEWNIEPGATDPFIEKFKQANVNLGNAPVAIANPDNVKPQVVLTYPRGEGAFSSDQLLHALASDNSGDVTKVEFYIDNNLIKTVAEYPYTANADMSGMDIYDTEIKVLAYDNSGNIGSYIYSGPQSSGEIRASIEVVTNFNTSNKGATYLSWSANGCQKVVVTFQVDGGEETQFAAGSTSLNDVRAIIDKGHVYTFKLYSATVDEQKLELLDNVVVYGGEDVVTVGPPVQASNDPKVFNYPNPVADNTIISFDGNLLENAYEAEIIILDYSGKQAKKVDVSFTEGKVEINTTGMNPGMYFYTLIVDQKVVAYNKMLVL